MACATTRALANVKSSAITPRQPSVPNLMDAMTLNYTRCERLTNSRIGRIRSRAIHECGCDLPRQSIADPAEICRLGLAQASLSWTSDSACPVISDAGQRYRRESPEDMSVYPQNLDPALAELEILADILSKARRRRFPRALHPGRCVLKSLRGEAAPRTPAAGSRQFSDSNLRFQWKIY